MWFAVVGLCISAHTPGGSERRRRVCFGAAWAEGENAGH